MFRTPLRLEAIADRPRYFRLLDELEWREGEGRSIVVPIGFETDLASIPRAIQILPSFGQTGRSMPCGVVHDFEYARQRLTRAQADELLRRMLLAVGVNRAAARMYFLGVRSFGWLPWNRYAKAKERQQ